MTIYRIYIVYIQTYTLTLTLYGHSVQKQNDAPRRWDVSHSCEVRRGRNTPPRNDQRRTLQECFFLKLIPVRDFLTYKKEAISASLLK